MIVISVIVIIVIVISVMSDERNTLITKQEVADFVTRHLKEGKSDREIWDMLAKECDWLEFGECRKIDSILGDGGGPYWRSAYNYPKVGDIRSPEIEKELIVVSAGFFTFRMEPRDEKIEDDENEVWK